jgi:hypothetical protein
MGERTRMLHPQRGVTIIHVLLVYRHPPPHAWVSTGLRCAAIVVCMSAISWST